jgi:Zn-dependent oligopeptidase
VTVNAVHPLACLPYAIPFSEVDPADLVPKLVSLVSEAQARLDAIVAHAGPRTWGNTPGALDRATARLDELWGLAHHLRSVRFSPELDAAVNEATGPVSTLYTSIALNVGLYAALRDYAATDEAKALTGPRRRYLDRTLADFRRRGADLPPEGKAELQALAGEIANLANTFTRHVLESTAAWSHDLAAEPAGVPAWATGMMRAAAEADGASGWRVKLQAPVVTAVLMHADDRSLRHAVWRAWNHRAAAAPHNNGPVLRRMLEIRAAQARLLGFADFADYVLGDRMAGSGARAAAFVASVEDRTRSAFLADNADLQAFAASRGAPTPLAPWDVNFWAERLRHARYELDDEELRPYPRRPDLRQPHAAERRAPGAAHPPRGRDPVPRVRPPAPPPLTTVEVRSFKPAPTSPGTSSSCPRRSWRTGAGSARASTSSPATTRPASRCPTPSSSASSPRATSGGINAHAPARLRQGRPGAAHWAPDLGDAVELARDIAAPTRPAGAHPRRLRR